VDIPFIRGLLILTIAAFANLGSAMEPANRAEPDQMKPDLSTQTIKEVRLKAMTLNCWGVPLYGSKDIDERFKLIGRHFAASDYDVLMFQEVWRDKDFKTLVRLLHDTFPHFHYFYSGIVGSGCCIFSKWRISDVIMHQYSLNGYVHKVFHADFMGAKALNGAILEKSGLRVAVFTTHLHAEYDHDNDEYLAHRVAQAYELSEVIRWAYKSTDCVILGGDLNLQPWNLGYRLILANAGLKDAWSECGMTEGGSKDEDGSTCDIRSNTYVDAKDLLKRPNGQRIDYILYRDGDGKRSTSCASCRVFAGKGAITDASGARVVSFSDHEGVEAELVVSPRPIETPADNLEEDQQLKALLEESLRAMRRGMDKVSSDRLFCASIIIVAIVVSLRFFYFDLVDGSQGAAPFLPQ